jgi:hypothetical protein
VKDGSYRIVREEKDAGYWVSQRALTLDDLDDALTFGAWTDDGGKVWLDVSYWIADLDNALVLGRKWNQAAIWDCRNGVAIYL